MSSYAEDENETFKNSWHTDEFPYFVLRINIPLQTTEEHIIKTTVYETRYVIVSKFRQNPKSVHEEISPKWRAILSNGDTIPCNKYSALGDTVVYQMVKH